MIICFDLIGEKFFGELQSTHLRSDLVWFKSVAFGVGERCFGVQNESDLCPVRFDCALELVGADARATQISDMVSEAESVANFGEDDVFSD